MITRRNLLASAMALGAWPHLSRAEQWPSRPIRFIVPFSAAGPTDALARQVAKQMQADFGQTLVIENLVGAAGQIGLGNVARATADGYTIGISANTIQTIAPHLGKLPYDTINGFTPLGGLAGFPYGLAVSAQSPINSVQDLVARAKAAPGTIKAGSAGLGTGADITINLLAQRAGIEVIQATYKGSAPVIQDLIAGHIDFTFDVISNVVPMWRQGLIKVIATTGATRHKVINAVPTMNELYPGFEFTAWFALYGPPDVPAPIVKRLSDELLSIQKTAEFQAFLEDRGFDAMPASAEALGKLTREEMTRWADVVARMPKRS
ncbi:tripartite tricarboxylate transporter substrate binding protein [soil metagenome]